VAKPILVIAIPYDSLSNELMQDRLIQLEKKLNDYHILAYRAGNITELTLEVLNADKANDLDIEKLKHEINSKINK
jgi:hypothetical protein